MSHTVKVKVNMTDKSLIIAVAKKLGYHCEEGRHRQYGGEQEGLGISLPGWRFPVVIQDNGEMAYDNFNGNWGSMEEFNKFQAHYGAEKVRSEALRMGYEVTESYNEQTSDIELTINVGG